LEAASRLKAVISPKFSGHPSEEGHELIAEATFAAFSDAGLDKQQTCGIIFSRFVTLSSPRRSFCPDR